MSKRKTIEDLVVEQVEEAVPEVIEEDLELVEDASDVEEAPQVVVPEAVTYEIATCVDGDSYPSLAEKHAPAGIKARDFAKELFVLNNGVVIRPGTRIRVKKVAE